MSTAATADRPSRPRLVLVKQEAEQVDRILAGGTLQRVHNVVKNQPFELELEWQAGSQSNLTAGLPDSQLKVELLLDATKKHLPAGQEGPLFWKQKKSTNSQIAIEVRIRVLSSSMEGSWFRLHISLVNTAGLLLADALLSEPIRVLAKKVSIKRALDSTTADAPATPAKNVSATSPAPPPLSPREPLVVVPTSPPGELEPISIKLDYLRRLTAAAHGVASSAPAVVTGAPRSGTSASRSGLTAPMKASTSDLSTLPTLFGSTSELFTSTFDLQASIPLAASTLPPPLPPPGADEVLDNAFTVLLAVASREAPEARVQKLRRFLKAPTNSTPAFMQLAKEVAEGLNTQQR